MPATQPASHQLASPQPTPALTLHDKFCSGLEALGQVRIRNSKQAKYSVYSTSQPGQFFFVGAAGALRIGKSASKSFACSDRTKAAVMGAYLAQFNLAGL